MNIVKFAYSMNLNVTIYSTLQLSEHIANVIFRLSTFMHKHWNKEIYLALFFFQIFELTLLELKD